MTTCIHRHGPGSHPACFNDSRRVAKNFNLKSKIAYPVNSKEFLAGIAVGSISPSLKKTFLPKVQKAMLGVSSLKLVSIDLEAFAPGDPRYKPDALLLVAGVQTLTFKGDSFKTSRITQYVLNGNSALDLARQVHEYCKGADGIIGHYSKWDLDILRNYEPKVRRRFHRFTPLPEACIDIMAPIKNLGISAGQEHLCSHYDLGVEKARVNLEGWQDATIGELEGISKREVMRLRHRIRDERNKGCLAANVAQIGFLSQNIRYMNKLTTKETYPNLEKMKELLGK